MLSSVKVNLVGQVVAVRAKKSNVLIAAKVIAQTDGTYTVEYAAGNTQVVDKRYVSIAPAWLKEEWLHLKSE